MLLDLPQMKNMVLLDKVIANKPVRVLYYRISAWTKQFERFAFLKKLFYPSAHQKKRKQIYIIWGAETTGMKLCPAFTKNARKPALPQIFMCLEKKTGSAQELPSIRNHCPMKKISFIC